MRSSLVLLLVISALASTARAGEWVPAENGFVPPGAFVAGEERGRPLVLCRADYNGGVHPGKVVGPACNFGWGGREVSSPRYQVFVGGRNERWFPGAGGSVPPEPFLGGSENGRGLAVCRARYEGGIHPGKLVGQNCNIGWGGREILSPEYEVLAFMPEAAMPVAAPAGPRWEHAANGFVPPGAFVAGGEGGRPLVLCRARYAEGIHPGKVVGPACNIGFGGNEVPSPEYEVLVGVTGDSWVPSAGGQIPPNAFFGGEEHGRPLAVCRAHYEHGTHPGKVVGQNCNFGWGGREILSPEYEVLVLGQAAPQPVYAPPQPVYAPPPPVAMAEWIHAQGGMVPPNAFVAGGENGHPLVLCRAHHEGGMHPGKVVGPNCNFGWGGREIMKPEYEVLVNLQGERWVHAEGGFVPEGAFVAGGENGHGLVLCRAHHEGGMHPGKVVGPNCNFGWGGREISKPDYEVLVAAPAR